MNNGVALVTNANRFLGTPTIESLSDAGFTIVAHDSGFVEACTQSAFLEAHPNCVPVSEQSAGCVARKALSLWGRLDVVVSNDWYPAIHATIDDAQLSELRNTLARVVEFPFELMQSLLPYFKEQRDGRVIMITSCRTNLPMEGGSIPDIARAGANAFVKSLALELAPYGVPVNAVAPNFVYSEEYFPADVFVKNLEGANYVRKSVPIGRLGRPDEAGELVRFLATAKGNFMTGSIIELAGGWPAAPRHR
jgi:NAD(P)-dependent dehydrogenase (short-subunit alcohol dehydrogenase family)